MKIHLDQTTLLFCAFIGIANSLTSQRICRSEEFRCLNGECIATDLLCDGRAHCTDESDETREECTKPQYICPTYAFRCNYGACIDSEAPCNGVYDCLDGSDELLPSCRNSDKNNSLIAGLCGKDEFRCNNGQCIPGHGWCDGRLDCADLSDEILETCSSIECPGYTFRCVYGACIDANLKCNGISNCADGSDEDPYLCQVTQSPIPMTPKTVTTLPTQPTVKPPISLPQSTVQPPISLPQLNESPLQPFMSCHIPPPQPNGRWQLYRCQQSNNEYCNNIRSDSTFSPGTRLVYSCNEGYRIRGSRDVFCGSDGKWFKRPVCAEIRCRPPVTTSIQAESCYYNDQWISCNAAVFPKSVATISCRTGYHEISTNLSSQRRIVMCNARGKWKPELIRCAPNAQIVNINFNGPIVAIQAGCQNNCTSTKPIEVAKPINNDRQAHLDNPPIDVRMRNAAS